MKPNAGKSRAEDVRSQLTYEPRDLRFGTSGRRGLVADLTQLEIYINVLGELEYLQTLAAAKGGITAEEDVFLGYDLRPSSINYAPGQAGRGEIAQAAIQAIEDAGMKAVNTGSVPTPALTYYALVRHRASIMVTGSHIPFDRNGYKMNTSKGELLKEHEEPIALSVARVRERVYSQHAGSSLFNEFGGFKTGHRDLPREDVKVAAAYQSRYTEFFQDQSLKGKRIVVYEHSAVGRDILCGLLRKLGAEVIPVGRSDSFVPIDTENIEARQLQLIQGLANEAAAAHGVLDAVISTDGDSDRPLILGVHPETGAVQFFGGDLVGMVVAEFLGADAVVVPISCNDAIDRGSLAGMVEPKTRIGSPFVIAGIADALAKGRKIVCGWEANGGFLLGSDLSRKGHSLRALPTRDAILPILCTLFSAQKQGLALVELFAKLPKRFSRAALLKDFPRPVANRIIKLFSPSDPRVIEFDFEDEITTSGNEPARQIRGQLSRFLISRNGFGEITKLNYVDGVRVTLTNGDVMHIRPSGNADELRVYAVADTQGRADQIVSQAVAEPDGILRQMERSLGN